MDTTIKINIKPHIVDVVPEISILVDRTLLYKGKLESQEEKVFRVLSLEPGPHQLRVVYSNNQDVDPTLGDMAVEITSVQFQYLDNDFKHLSQYRPQYPEGFPEQDPDKWTPVIHSNYLGWNGEWSLDFETPIYRWIHQQLNMGWLI